MRTAFHGRAWLAVAMAALSAASAVLVPARADAAPQSVIVFPPDKALLSGNGSLDLLGFKTAEAPGSGILTGKGGPRAFTVGNGAFTAKVQLEPGENTIEFGGRTITVFFPGGDSAAIPPGFSPPDTHAVDNGCEDCHAFKGGSVDLLEKPPGLCTRCHDDVLKDKNGKPQAVLHPPAEEGDCLACHAFHGLAIKKLPAAAKRELCFGCHDDFTDGGKKRMHAPVAKGECTGCHGVHAAPVKMLLPATGLKLCLLCHADPSRGKDGKELAVPHPALDDGCASCHLPHVADAPRLLKKPVAQVCADCHDPFPADEGGKPLVRHSPVEEGECGGCHAVHGSNTKKLLAASGTSLCVKCHDDPSRAPGGKEWATPHPALDDGCPSCHLPHVAPAAGLLKKEQASLCYDCHDAFTPPPADKGSMHRPVAQGACARCHAPHGSAGKKLLKASPSRDLCLACHKDPARSLGGEAWAVPHPALDDGCPSCHLPHTAQAPRLLTRPQRELCAGCHEDKNLNSGGAEWSTPHPPVASGMCASCHAPHGSPEKALLAKSLYEICLGCHTEVHTRHRKVTMDPSTGNPLSSQVTLPQGFPVRKRDGVLSCIGCHRPHGADYPRLWDKDEINFCNQCHPM
jgi:predicted CXXCH cytochrome family protein